MNYVIADRRSKSGAVITCRAKVNPAEHTGVLDLVQRGGKAGEARTPRHSVRRYAARRVFAEPRTKDLRRRSAHARVRRRVLGKRRSGDERRPIRVGGGIGIPIVRSLLNRRYRPPG